MTTPELEAALTAAEDAMNHVREAEAEDDASSLRFWFDTACRRTNYAAELALRDRTEGFAVGEPVTLRPCGSVASGSLKAKPDTTLTGRS